MTAADRIVIVGAGIAGVRAAEEVLAQAPDTALTLLDAESEEPYDRPPLSKELLRGTRDAGDIRLISDPRARAALRTGAGVAGLDTGARRLRLESGEELGYDGLIIATGRGAAPWRFGGTAHTLRTLADLESLRSALAGGRKHVAVVGGGFIGMEMASSLLDLGHDVSVVEYEELPLARCGHALGELVAERATESGVNLLAGRGVVSCRDEAGGVVLDLTDGSTLRADVLLASTGSRPSASWLQGSDLVIDPCVHCDERLFALRRDSTVHPDITVAGDVAVLSSRAAPAEHWADAAGQGALAARNLLAGPADAAPYTAPPSYWSDMFDLAIRGVGEAGLDAVEHEDVLDQPGKPPRRVITYRHSDGALAAVTAVNRAAAVARLTRELGMVPVTTQPV